MSLWKFTKDIQGDNCYSIGWSEYLRRIIWYRSQAIAWRLIAKHAKDDLVKTVIDCDSWHAITKRRCDGCKAWRDTGCAYKDNAVPECQCSEWEGKDVTAR